MNTPWAGLIPGAKVVLPTHKTVNGARKPDEEVTHL